MKKIPSYTLIGDARIVTGELLAFRPDFRIRELTYISGAKLFRMVLTEEPRRKHAVRST